MAHRFRREVAAIRCVLLGVAVCSAAVPAKAGDVFWSNGRGDGSGAFSNESNWIPDLPFSSDVPDDNDVAHFGMTISGGSVPTPYTVSFNFDPTNLRQTSAAVVSAAL